LNFINQKSLQTILDMNAAPVWVVDTSFRLLLYNHAFHSWIFHFTGHRLAKGAHMLDEAYGRFYLNKFEPCYQTALSGNSLTTVEDLFVNGEQKFSTIQFSPAYDQQMQVNGIICHASDITEQRLQLMQLNEQSNILIDIAHIQSHKVRGPVASILGLVQLFNFEDLSDPDNKEIMRGIVTSTEHLDELIREVITKINRLSQKRQYTPVRTSDI
jgi:nitrogen-specific signal transduction histidine kinase